MQRQLKPFSSIAIALALLLGTLGAGAAQAKTCSPSSPADVVAPGVTFYNCYDTFPSVYVVTIDRTLLNMHLQVLAQPTGEPGRLHLRELKTLGKMNDAVVAINGFYWGPKSSSGMDCWIPRGQCDDGTPTTTVFLDGERISSSGEPEVLMGFTAGDTGIQARRIPRDKLFDPGNEPYRQWMYGSFRTMMANGKFERREGEGDDDYQSIVGYSDRYIIFLVTQQPYRLEDLPATLSAFGASEAVLNDGGHSAGLYIRGRQPIDPSGASRKIAYAIGLVPGLPKGSPPLEPPTSSTNAAEHRMETEAQEQGNGAGSANAAEHHMETEAQKQEPAPQRGGHTKFE